MPKGLRRSSKKQAVAQLVRVLNERSAKLQQEPFWEKEYDSLILADGPKGTYSMDPHISQVNNNVLVIAGTGGGTADEEWSSMIIRMQGLAEEATEEWRKSFDPERTIDSAYYFVDSLEASYRWNFALRRAQTEGTAWSPYYSTWFGGSGGYGDSGLAGTANGGFYDAFVFNGEEFELRQQNSDVLLATMTEDERREYIDWCLAKEYSKEYVAEGKAYGYLCKMAERYSHAGRGSRLTAADKMADIIAPKYTGALQSKVRSSLQGKYFINWNLK